MIFGVLQHRTPALQELDRYSLWMCHGVQLVKIGNKIVARSYQLECWNEVMHILLVDLHNLVMCPIPEGLSNMLQG